MTIDAVLYLMVGAGLTLASQLVLQLVIVPRVETRKRREDRWERDVLALGELLTGDIPDRASAAYISQSVLQHYYHRLMPPGQVRDAATLEHLKEESREAVRGFRDLASTRMKWLTQRIVNIAPQHPDIKNFDTRVIMYHMTATVCTFYSDERAEDYDEDKYSDLWSKERKQRAELADLVAVMMRGKPPRDGLLWFRLKSYPRRFGSRIQRAWAGQGRADNS